MALWRNYHNIQIQNKGSPNTFQALFMEDSKADELVKMGGRISYQAQTDGESNPG